MLAEVASQLGAKDVNILAFIGAVIEGRGAVRMIVDKPAAARKVFTDLGWETTEQDVMKVTLADQPGSLGKGRPEAGESRGQRSVRLYGLSGRAKSQHLLRGVRPGGCPQGAALIPAPSPCEVRHLSATPVTVASPAPALNQGDVDVDYGEPEHRLVREVAQPLR
jgi:hypothetical protein